MGMFDNVECRHTMPDGFTGGSFQTKSLDSIGDGYTVTPEGRLHRTFASNWTGDPAPLGDLAFNGDVCIYAADPVSHDWHEYTLLFVDGTLVRIICHGTGRTVAVAPPPSADAPAPSQALSAIMAAMQSRERVGLVKYGTTVDRGDLAPLQWLQHLDEELMDALMYSRALRRGLERPATAALLAHLQARTESLEDAFGSEVIALLEAALAEQGPRVSGDARVDDAKAASGRASERLPLA